MLIYPRPLKRGDTIGICAPSSGVSGPYSARLENAKKQLSDLGYNLTETASVQSQTKLTSAPPDARAKEFIELYFDEKVTAIIPPWGGEFCMDMLPYLPFQEMKGTEPKWVMGFSDTSTLLFAITLNLNMATAHGPNLLDYG
ncbi:MAG: LD-carboxypeptidase, partial [Halanaerobium sp.]|nr:LD-carboxypeptidase [Halanaerobium sp.]